MQNAKKSLLLNPIVRYCTICTKILTSGFSCKRVRHSLLIIIDNVYFTDHFILGNFFHFVQSSFQLIKKNYHLTKNFLERREFFSKISAVLGDVPCCWHNLYIFYSNFITHIIGTLGSYSEGLCNGCATACKNTWWVLSLSSGYLDLKKVKQNLHLMVLYACVNFWCKFKV